MAYPQQRMPPSRGPPPGPGSRSQASGNYAGNGLDNGYDNMGGGGRGPDYGPTAQYPGQTRPRQPPPRGAPGGNGGPPPGPPSSGRSPGGYGRGPLPGPGRGPPPGVRGPPPRGAPMGRPPPQRRPPGGDAYGYPTNGPPSQRRGSDEQGLARQMGDMSIASPPVRPHTSNSSRPPRGPPSGDPYYLDQPQSYGDQGFAPPQRSYTMGNAPPPIKVPQRSMTSPNANSPYAPPLRSPKYPGQSTYNEPLVEHTEPEPGPNSMLVPNNSRDEMKYKTFSTYVHHNVFADYFADQDAEEGGDVRGTTTVKEEEEKEEEDDDLDMPNFDAMPASDPVHRRNESFEHSLSSAPKPQGTYAPYKPVTSAGPTNQFADAGFQFDLPGDPSADAMNHTYSGISQGSERTPSTASYGTSRMSNPESQNPDALPAHPLPYRAGLDQSPGDRPAPVRQYGGPPPQNNAAPPPQASAPAPMGPNGRPESPPVTQTEIERLQIIVRHNPDDYKTTLKLAKKYVEASTRLIGEEGRVDPKTRARNKDKYIHDAYKLVKKMVNDAYPDAMFYLADSYGHGGLGLQADPREAFQLYQSAAKAGHAESAYRTAVCCELGQEEGGGTRRDALKAVQWYRRAAALGNTPAMYKMGIILLKGLLGQQKNPREAVTWLKRAADGADAENPHALHELGLMYESSAPSDFIIRDEAYARELFTQAAELGYKFSQYRLGAAYEQGLLGLPIDARMSIVWYTRAAAQGEHQSELALSGWYLTGADGILQQSDTEAYLWARKAAAAGLAKAEYAMGYFTEVGIGVPSNLEDAQRWYWRAASQNFNKARERLEELKKGSGRMQKTRVSRSAVAQQQQQGGECSVM